MRKGTSIFATLITNELPGATPGCTGCCGTTRSAPVHSHTTLATTPSHLSRALVAFGTVRDHGYHPAVVALSRWLRLNRHRDFQPSHDAPSPRPCWGLPAPAALRLSRVRIRSRFASQRLMLVARCLPPGPVGFRGPEIPKQLPYSRQHFRLQPPAH